MQVKPSVTVLITIFLAVAAGSAGSLLGLRAWSHRCTLTTGLGWSRFWAEKGSAPAETEAGVRQTLIDLQQGYRERDTAKLEGFLERISIEGDGLVIVGTVGGEQLRGREAARRFFTTDWKYWGDLTLNAGQARIDAEGDAAWMLTEATIRTTNGETHPVVLSGVLVRRPQGWRFRQLQFQVQKCPDAFTGIHPQTQATSISCAL